MLNIQHTIMVVYLHVRLDPLMKSYPGMIKVRHGFFDESHKPSNASKITVGA